MKKLQLFEEQDIIISVNGFEIVLKHNDVGISFDVYKNNNLLEDRQFWFEDWENYYADIEEKEL